MTEKKILLIFALITLLILGSGVYFLLQTSSSAKVPVSANSKVAVDQTNFDWGQIPMSGGNVEKTFTIKNSGTEVLKLVNIKTSCHCTKAQVVINNSTSPFFGMDSVSSWVGEVLPGQEAKLNVIFDPAYHGPSGVGPINRLVSVQTNDTRSPRIEFSLTGTVVK